MFRERLRMSREREIRMMREKEKWDSRFMTLVIATFYLNPERWSRAMARCIIIRGCPRDAFDYHGGHYGLFLFFFLAGSGTEGVAE